MKHRYDGDKNPRIPGAISLATGILACSLALPMLATEAQAATFHDTQGHWAEANIQKWAEAGVLAGSGGYFRPDDSITRGDMAVILNGLMGYKVQANNDYSDLGDAYYTEAVLKLNSAGIMSGYQGKIRPTEAITREEAAVVLANALHIDYNVDQTSTGFSDNAEISPWARGAVSALSKLGMIGGREGYRFAPNDYISRAEVATILAGGVAMVADGSGTYHTRLRALLS